MKIFRNIVGVLAGLIAFVMVGLLIHNVFLFLLRIPFLVTLLSYPSSPDLYVNIGIISCSSLAGMGVCSFIAVANKYGYKIANIILGMIYVLLGIANIVSIIFVTNFSWSLLISQIFLIGIGVIAVTSSKD